MKITGHQGDVQFKELNSLPTGLKKIENQPIAYGEISGHVHILTGEVEMYQHEDMMYAVIGEEGALLQHVLEVNIKKTTMKLKEKLTVADHGIIELNKGIYQFGIQKRYNPFSKVFERVID